MVSVELTSLTNQLFEVTVKFKISDHKIRKFHIDGAEPQTEAIKERKPPSPQRKLKTIVGFVR